MKAQPQREVERVFHLVADLSREERAPLLEELCAGQAGLRRQVDALLEAHDGSNILDEHLDLEGLSAGPHPALGQQAFEPGQAVGPYHIVRILGTGGMGTVYLAEQLLPVHRQVALKVVHAGPASDEVLRRFESERQALALLDCAHVARIFDAGSTEDHRPYFTMEFIDGTPITRYADAHRLSIRERLELFLQVCEGIRHAHQRGIVHRDIKPTNVLVAEVDGTPIAKVIDFGVARILEPAAAADRTSAGVVLGTPEYMSPEQSDTGGRDADTRSDVYSAGVLLFELLVGDLPYSREKLAQMRDAPRVNTPLPSQRITQLEEGGARQAERRHASTTALRRALRGELDWICLRALELERGDRYQTIGELSDDVRRSLRNEAVVAGPPSATYRFRKFARRHRALIGSLSAVALSLVTATVVSGVFYVQEQAARDAAERNERRSAAVADFARRSLSEVIAAKDSPAEGAWAAAVTEAISLVEADQDLDARDLAAFRVTLGNICLESGDPEMAREQFTLAETTFAISDGVDPYEHAECLVGLARIDVFHDQSPEPGQRRLHRAIDLVTEGHGPTTYERALLYTRAGQVLLQTNDQAGARDVLRQARASFPQVEVRGALAESLHQTHLRCLVALFRSLNAAGELVEARDVLDEAEALAVRHDLRDGATRMELNKGRSMVAARFGNWEQAAAALDSIHAFYREALGDASATTLFYAGRHAHALARAGHPDKAATILAPAIDTARGDERLTRSVLYKLLLFRGDTHWEQAHPEQARRDYEAARAGFQTVYGGEESVWSGRAAHCLGVIEAAAGESGLAVAHFRRAHAIFVRKHGPGSFDANESAQRLAELLIADGEYEAAEELVLDAHQHLKVALGADASATRDSAALIERLYTAWGRPQALHNWRNGIRPPRPPSSR